MPSDLGQRPGMIRTPPPRAPGTPPRTGRPVPPDISARAGNDHTDRVPARALRGTDSPDRYLRVPSVYAPISDTQCYLAGTPAYDRNFDSYSSDTDSTARRARHQFPKEPQ